MKTLDSNLAYRWAQRQEVSKHALKLGANWQKGPRWKVKYRHGDDGVGSLPDFWWRNMEGDKELVIYIPRTK